MTKKFLLLAVLSITLIISVIVSVSIGSINIPFGDILRVLSGGDDLNSRIIMDIRLPRVLNALLIGAALSCAGIILQSMLRNNLAEPGLLGISAGAGLGAILIFSFPVSVSFFVITPVSFAFAVITTLIIFFIARGLNNKYTNFISSNKIILAGIAVNALLSSLNSFFLQVSGENIVRIISWLNGGLSGKGWAEFQMMAVFVVIGIIAALLISKDLNVLNLGEELAVSLGLNIKTVQKIAIAASSLLAAAAVSVAGIISFVGLVIPNITKLLIGTDYRYAVPCSILLGGIFMILSDLLARTIVSPSEVPVGIVTSFIGAPVFIWLIFKSRKGTVVE